MGAWRSGIKEEQPVIDRCGGQPRSYVPVPLRLEQEYERYQEPRTFVSLRTRASSGFTQSNRNPLGLRSQLRFRERKTHPGNRSRSFIFQNLPVDVRGTASMNS